MSVNVKPLADRVLVEASPAETTTASGIIIPDTAKEKPQRGTVIAVGPGKLDDKGKSLALEVTVGDTILFSSYSGTEYKADDIDYLILSEDDVLAVLGG